MSAVIRRRWSNILMLCVGLLGGLTAITHALVLRQAHLAETKIDIRTVPDVVIEREMFRRVGMLTADTCTFCKEKYSACECELGKHGLMFQNRERQSPEFIKAELLKYGVKE